ncbi:hypothetical protein COJ01_17095 [Priestia megaterium]|uniref:hypothetical protein n=1 Tax=Priestia megaterium TaxID=1404 RepID=UPI000BFA551B|nr:hypothetical protein [Priestia megaterium]PFK99788.1 hypothetical protein COJ01_17095 [Priestia megaterium]
MNSVTYIEQQFSFSVSEFEGLWSMTFMHPYNREEHLSIYLVAPNSDYDESKITDDKPIVEAGPRLTDFLNHLLYKIEYYPYTWDLAGKKIVSFGYDFECDYNGTSLTEIDFTEIAFKEVNEYYNFFSPLEADIVTPDETVSGKGVMAKLKITLDKPKYVNHLNIDYFTEYPIELLTLMYRADESSDATIYEIPLSKAVQTNSSIHLHFSPVFAKTFYLIIKQESYTLLDGSKSEADISKEEIWKQASTVSKSMYEAAVGDYISQLFATKSAVDLHQTIMDSYQNINKNLTDPSMEPMNEYRNDFNKIKTVLDSQQR